MFLSRQLAVHASGGEPRKCQHRAFFQPLRLALQHAAAYQVLHSNLLVLPSALFFVFSSTNRCRTLIDMDSFTGGDPERYYYSFDFGSVHFINLDSEHDYAVGSAQYR